MMEQEERTNASPTQAPRAALIIVDVQNDFCRAGSLQVADANSIISLINELRELPVFQHVVLTRDWHPKNHCSFAENHPGTKVFDQIKIEETGTMQVMWPTHCVKNTRGAQFSRFLVVKQDDFIVNKGQIQCVDSYSGFGQSPEQTDLQDDLLKNKIQTVYCVGLAFDYCVGNTALDAKRLGFETYVIKDATRSVSVESEQEMMSKLQNAGVRIIDSQAIKSVKNGSFPKSSQRVAAMNDDAEVWSHNYNDSA